MKTLLYLFSIVEFTVAVFFFRKTKNKLSGVSNLFLSIILVQSTIALIGGVEGLFSIPISCYTVCPILMIFGIILLKIEKNRKQEFYFTKEDVVYLILMIAVFLCIWVLYFGIRLNLRFVSVDASVHARFAKEIALKHTISSNLFFSYLNDGLFMEAMLPFTGEFGFYHSFVFMRLIDYFVSGLAIYSAFNIIVRDKYTNWLSMVFSCFYLIGYPLYVILFGFVYFGSAVTVVTALIIVFDLHYRKHLLDKSYFEIMNLLLFAVFTSYTLFVPPVFLSVLLYYILQMRKQRPVISKKMVMDLVKIFAIPCILGMAYAWVNLKELSPGGAVSRDGGRYFDLYSNFVFLMPAVLAYVYQSFKNKNLTFNCILLITSSIFTAILIFGSFENFVSIYYLSKMYNILWLCCFYALFFIICLYSKQIKALINSSLCVAVFLFFMSMCQVDRKLNENKQYVNVDAASFMNLYAFNGNFFKNQPRFSELSMEMFKEVCDLTKDMDSQSMIYVGDEITGNWYITFTEQHLIYVGNSVSELAQLSQDNNVKYLCIHTESVTEELVSSISSFGVVENEGASWKIIRLWPTTVQN